MTAGQRDALDALARRIVQLEAIATIIARDRDDAIENNALNGLSDMIGDLSAQVDAILDQKPE